MKAKNIGIKVPAPKKECKDDKCPFHGSLKVRGRSFTGTVISSKMSRTVSVEWEWKNFLPKYERYEKKRTRIKAHNPDCLSAEEGDIVNVKECRPLSKTKNFVVIEKLGKEKGYLGRIEAREASKVEKPKKEPIVEEEKKDE
jgi:small subunit ribosomal protein S17